MYMHKQFPKELESRASSLDNFLLSKHILSRVGYVFTYLNYFSRHSFGFYFDCNVKCYLDVNVECQIKMCHFQNESPLFYFFLSNKKEIYMHPF